METDAFIELLEQVVSLVRQQLGERAEKRWIRTDEAKALLGVQSNTTLQKLRDEGKLRFSQPQHKIILYDRHSINEYLENHAKNTF